MSSVDYSPTRVFSRRRLAAAAGVIGVAVILLAGPSLALSIFDSTVASHRIPGSDATLADVPEPKPPVLLKATPRHKDMMLLLDVPGVTKPVFDTVEKAMIAADARVIGITVGQQAYAFPVYLLDEPPTHVLNLLLSETPVSVTYCDAVDCARVFTQDADLGRIDLGVGGQDTENQMVLKLGDERHGQSSKTLPLETYDHQLMTFDEWRRLHPKTLVYDGPEPGSISTDWKPLKTL